MTEIPFQIALRTNTQEIEAANRAEVTALLIRSGFRVYRPEADVDGEDLVLATPQGDLIKVQLKGRAFVDWEKYGEKNIWMLFPSSKFSPSTPRSWFLIEHDRLFGWVEPRHKAAPKWTKVWSYPSISIDLAGFLKGSEIKPLEDGEFL